jgi:hypothetical protein
MARNVVFLVHGMGRQPAGQSGDWASKIVTALDDAWGSFDALAGKKREDYVEFVPIGYDEVFTKYLASFADQADLIDKVLPANKAKEFFAALGDAGKDENFFWDDVVDILLYRYGADLYRNVHVAVQEQLVRSVNERWDKQGKTDVRFSMIAHSLGTAVAHGALNRMGGGKLGSSSAFKLGGSFFLQTYMTLANVSGVLWWGEHELYDSTIVRPPLPGRAGYVNALLNVRNALDPFPMPKRFSPSDWGDAYVELVLDHLQMLNIHAFEHYLAHPRVTGAFYRSLLGANRLPEESIQRALLRFEPLSLVAPNKRAALAQLRDSLAQDLRASFAGDKGIIPSVAELFGKVVATGAKQTKDLRKLLGGIL